MTNKQIQKELISTLNNIKECKEELIISNKNNKGLLTALLRNQEMQLKRIENDWDHNKINGENKRRKQYKVFYQWF